MNDDYLWDGSGEPDPEIQKLESTLAKFRHKGQGAEFPAITAAPRLRFWQRIMPSQWSFGLVAATATILFIAAFGVLQWSQKPNAASGPGWDVESVAGTPQVESNAFWRNTGAAKLGVGQTLVTDSHSKANISIADVGTVNVEPNTRLRLVAGGNGHNRLALDRRVSLRWTRLPRSRWTSGAPIRCRWTIQVQGFCERNWVGLVSSWMDMKHSFPLAQFAPRGRKLGLALRTLTMLPRRFGKP
jgi:hypothetical protein